MSEDKIKKDLVIITDEQDMENFDKLHQILAIEFHKLYPSTDNKFDFQKFYIFILGEKELIEKLTGIHLKKIIS